MQAAKGLHKRTRSGKSRLKDKLSLRWDEKKALWGLREPSDPEFCNTLWDGNPQSDTENVIYTVTRPGMQGGPPPVTMYDLIRAALRCRPHGIIIGEARGPEAWELVRAAATGHGHSAFTIHATGAEHVWPRFLQVVQAHPDAQRLDEYQIAQGFAEAVTTVMHLERSPQYGQIVREIAEVSTVVERAASRPAFLPLFRFQPGEGLLPTGNRPQRPGFRAGELNLPESYFVR